MRFLTLIDRIATTFMKKGKRAEADRLVQSVVHSFKLSHGSNYQQVIEKAIKNLTPKISLRSRKKAGLSYKIPVAIPDRQAFSLALRWLYQAVNSRPEPQLEVRLYRELLDASNMKGEGVKKRELLHQTAILNRGFVKFFR